jgi:hypothetical protein
MCHTENVKTNLHFVMGRLTLPNRSLSYVTNVPTEDVSCLESQSGELVEEIGSSHPPTHPGGQFALEIATTHK